MASKNSLYEKLRQSISFITKNSEEEIKYEKEDTELATLNNYIRDLKIQQENIQANYDLLVNKHHDLYKGLIGTTITNYYIEYANKFLHKVNSLVPKISLLSEDGELMQLLSNLDYLLNSQPDKSLSIESLLKETTSIIEQLESSVANVSGAYDSATEEFSITDNSAARFKYSFIKKSGYVKMFDVSGPNMYLYVTIYGCLTSDGKVLDDEIYLTCAALGLTNIKLVKVKKKIKFFIWSWTYNEYRGIIKDKSDEENLYGIVLSFKSGFFGGYNSLFSDNFRRVKLKKGYYVDGIIYQHEGDNYGKYYNKFLQISGDQESGFSVNKFLDYIKNKSIEDKVFKDTGPGEDEDLQPKGLDSSPNIRYVYRDSDQEYIKVGLYTAKYRPYISKSTIQTKVILDRDSLDYNNENTLCDFITVSLQDLTTRTFDIKNLQFDANGTEEIDGVSYYRFKSTYTPGSDAENGTLGNSIPLIIRVSKGNTSSVSSGANNTTLTHELFIELGIDSDEDVILQDTNDAYELYGEMGAYSSPIVRRTAQSKITDLDDIKEDPLYILTYISTVLQNFHVLSKPKQKEELLRLVELVERNRDVLLEQLLIYLKNIYRALNTIGQCDAIRRTYDIDYDNSLYGHLVTLTQTSAAEMRKITDITSVQSLLKTKTNIDNLNSTIKFISSETEKLLNDLLLCSIYLDEIIDSYSCIFNKTDNSRSILSSLEIAMSIYEGKSSFTEAMSLSGMSFLPINTGNKSFEVWYENVLQYIMDNDIMIARYYLLIILLCNLSSNSYENRKIYRNYLNDFMLKMLNRMSISKEYVPVAIQDLLRANNNFIESYGFYIVAEPNNDELPAYLMHKYPMLKELNTIDILYNSESYSYNQIIKSKLLIFLLSNKDNMDSIVYELYDVLSKNRNYRNIVVLQNLDAVLDYLNEQNILENNNLKLYKNRSNYFLNYPNYKKTTPIDGCLREYRRIRNSLYENNVNLLSLFNSTSSQATIYWSSLFIIRII